MRFFRQPPAQSLSAWLDVATRDLVPSAQVRIHAEIVAHYGEAVQSRVANGLSESIALTEALADLGSAKAARRFRQKYLTRMDALRIGTLTMGDGTWESTASQILWLLPCIICISPPKSDSLLSWLSMALTSLPSIIIAAAIIAIGVLAKRNDSTATMRQVILLHCVAPFIFSAYSLGVVWYTGWEMLHAKSAISGDPTQLILPAIIAAVCSNYCLARLRLRKKLLTAGEFWNELPPRKPVST